MPRNALEKRNSILPKQILGRVGGISLIERLAAQETGASGGGGFALTPQAQSVALLSSDTAANTLPTFRRISPRDLSASFSVGTNGQYLRTNASTTEWASFGTLTAGTGLSGGSFGVSSNATFSVIYGTTANTAAQGNDSRFHSAVTLGVQNGLSLSGQQLSLSLASGTSAGALRQLNSLSTHFLNGEGQWAVPPNTTNLVGTSGNGLTVTANSVSLALATASNAGALPTLSGNASQFFNGAGSFSVPNYPVTSVNGQTGAVSLTIPPEYTHPNSGVTVGTYGNNFGIPQIAINAQGHITSATEVAIPTFSGAGRGLVPSALAVSPQSTHFLRADGTWQTVGGLPNGALHQILQHNGSSWVAQNTMRLEASPLWSGVGTSATAYVNNSNATQGTALFVESNSPTPTLRVRNNAAEAAFRAEAVAAGSVLRSVEMLAGSGATLDINGSPGSGGGIGLRVQNAQQGAAFNGTTYAVWGQCTNQTGQTAVFVKQGGGSNLRLQRGDTNSSYVAIEFVDTPFDFGTPAVAGYIRVRVNGQTYRLAMHADF